MIIYVIIDTPFVNVIRKNLDYTKSEPLKERINKINGSYEIGHTIVIDCKRNQNRNKLV